jgi:hypothetical protein
MKIKYPALLFALLFVLCFGTPAWAVFNMTATPDDGGFDLKFGRLGPEDFKVTQQLTIRVMADEGVQYRVMHRYTQPLTSTDGTRLPVGMLRMYPRVGSSTMGSLLYREETPIEDLDTIIYTSNGSGTSDTFQLIYTMTPSQAQVPGSYYGRISYVLVPVNSTHEQVVVSLKVYVQLEAGSEPVVEIATDNGQKRVVLDGKRLQGGSAIADEWPRVIFRARAPLGSTYRVYQTLENGSLTSSTGQDFDLSQVVFMASGASYGTTVGSGDLKGMGAKQLLYTSSADGTADTFSVAYGPGEDFRVQPEGAYRGRIVYTVETMGRGGESAPLTQTMDLEIDIPPVFDIRVYSNGKEGVDLRFGDVSYRTGPKTSDVEINVETNMQRPYQIVQKVASPMANEKGDKVPPENFTIKVLSCGEEETPRFILRDITPVKQGDTVVFTSGARGKSTCLKVQYQLEMEPDSRSGNYEARIGYSLALN